MKRRTFKIFLGLLWMLAACGGGTNSRDAGPSGDGSPATDGMTMGDGGGAFDPSVIYPGEGDACEFSIRCGDQQLCVDDACIRHERLDPADVSVTDYRVLFGDEANPSPLLSESDTDWFSPAMTARRSSSPCTRRRAWTWPSTTTTFAPSMWKEFG